jgi:hypothetical protein
MTTTTDDRRSLFVVGSSRSGTTMVGRILDRHPAVHMFHELHFFEQMWSPETDATFTRREEAIDVAARLLCIERDGGYLAHGDPAAFRGAAGRLVDRLRIRDTTALDVYRRFLFREAAHNEAGIPCEQTPRNLFYLGEILEHFPEARVIHMVRDPRDVLLSQKRKWKRRFLGASSIPLSEALRSWINYHPITISRLWAAAERAAAPYADHPRVQTVAFEDVLADPEAAVRGVCTFAGIEFRRDMLAVRQVGSSNAEDQPEQRGIDADRAGTWRDGGLTDTEVYLCQKMIAAQLEGLPYTPVDVSPNPLELVGRALSFPLKLGAAFLVNLHRMNNVWDTIRRRLQ